MVKNENEMMEYQESVEDVIKLFIALGRHLPHSLLTLFGLFGIIESVINKLKSRQLLDSCLEQAFETCKEVRDGIMKQKPKKQNSRRQMERDDEREPDTNFRDSNVFPQNVNVAAGMDHNPFVRRNKEMRKVQGPGPLLRRTISTFERGFY